MVLATIQEVTGVGSLAADQDFYDAGVTSVQALPLLIELETKFDCMIPDTKFVSIRSAGELSAMIAKSRRPELMATTHSVTLRNNPSDGARRNPQADRVFVALGQ